MRWEKSYPVQGYVKSCNVSCKNKFRTYSLISQNVENIVLSKQFRELFNHDIC